MGAAWEHDGLGEGDSSAYGHGLDDFNLCGAARAHHLVRFWCAQSCLLALGRQFHARKDGSKPRPCSNSRELPWYPVRAGHCHRRSSGVSTRPGSATRSLLRHDPFPTCCGRPEASITRIALSRRRTRQGAPHMGGLRHGSVGSGPQQTFRRQRRTGAPGPDPSPGCRPDFGNREESCA